MQIESRYFKFSIRYIATEGMGIELLLAIATKMKRSVVFTTKGCSRSVCNHPFLVCILCFLIYMCRSSPFMFSLLVSASPVLVCTAALLGALLRFGQPNIPGNEVEEKTKHVEASVKSGKSSGDTDVARYFVEREVEKRRDGSGWVTMGASLATSKFNEIQREGSSDVAVASIEKRGNEKGGIREASRDLGDMRHKKKGDWNEGRIRNREVMESDYASKQKVNENLESDYEKSEAESFDSEKVNVDPGLGWQKVENQDDEGEEEDDMLDSVSEGSESTSPGASMTDIMPMLDELHPLLDEEALQPVQISCQGSQAASELSQESSISGNESDVETNDDLEVADNDVEDDEAEGDKEDQSEAAITWTEEDQKNLQDLGSSEIERNQRLETLMLRRRERKYKSMVGELNLIDLESSNPPFNIAPISTTKQNPFDVPNDSYANTGLPPVPGSAPSILLPRRNPFDIPCDSIEEKPNLMGGQFQEQLSMLQSKEPLFRRHESFSVGPLDFAHNRQGKQTVKFRPYFVPESLIQEKSGFSRFQQQSSEMSDSRLSSLPGTVSVSSAEDTHGQSLGEEVNAKEPEVISSVADSTERLLSGDREKENPKEIEVVSSMAEVTEKCSLGEEEPVSKRETSEDDKSRVPQLISETDHGYEDVGHGSQSSEEHLSLDLGQDDKWDIEFNDDKLPSPDDDDHLERGSAVQHAEVQTTGYHSGKEDVVQMSRNGSSSSPLSEVSERVLNDTTCEEFDDPDISMETSAHMVNSSPPDEVPHKEPVYDSSPPTSGKNFLSFNSFNMHSEPEFALLPAIVKRTISLVERKSVKISRVVEKDNSGNVEKLAGPSMFHSDKHKTSHVDVNEHEHSNNGPDSLEAARRPEGRGASSSDINSHSVVESSDDKNPGQSEDGKHSIILQRDNLAHVRVSSSDNQAEAMHSTNKEKAAASTDSNDEIYQEANDQISTPSVAGSTTVFYNMETQDPNTERLEEVQVPNTPVDSSEKMRLLPNLNIPNIHELIDTSSNSPYTPDITSMPSSAGPRVTMQTIVEETNETKEMSDLDGDGDLCRASHPNAFEKHLNSAGDASPTKIGNGNTGRSNTLPDAEK